MEKKSKKSVVIGITILLLVTLILLGLTYAYYRTRILGNEEEKSISVTSKKLEVTYSDDKAVIEASDIEPGYIATKTFTVENTGSEPTNFGIVLDNVENTFTRKSDWTFVLKQGNNVIREGIVPSQTSYILNTKSIAADETIEYTLTINYANLTTEDQSDDMGSTLSLRVNIDNETGAILESATDGTLLAAIRDDNLISEPLTEPGVARSSQLYLDSDADTDTYEVTVSEEQQQYYVIYADGYTFDKSNGTYTLINPKTAKYADVYSSLGGKYVVGEYLAEVFYETKPTEEDIKTLTVKWEFLSQVVNDPAPTLSSFTIYEKYTTSEDTYEAELSQTEDDYGTSYYYRGTVENNYVNFSGMCWRVVRVQGDGKIRLILADEDNLCNSENFVVNSKKSGYLNDIPYKYNSSTTTDISMLDYSMSDVSKILNVWLNGGTATLNDTTTTVTFEKKLDTTKLVETEWCNDLTYNYIANNGFITFGANARIGSNVELQNINTTLKCNFMGINNTEAQKISSNIGILSIDEVLFSGYPTGMIDNKPKTKWTNYLQQDGRAFWTMTPNSYQYSESIPFIQNYVAHNYQISTQGATSTNYYIRPVIALLPSTTISEGNGTQTNPYVIS